MDHRSPATLLCTALLVTLAGCGGDTGSGGDASPPLGSPSGGARFEDSPAYASYKQGKLLREQGLYERAEPELLRALDLDPFQPELFDEITTLMLETGKPIENTKSMLEQGLKLDPNHAGMHAKLGTVATLLQRPTEAVQHLQRSLELDTNQASVHFRLGRTLIYLADTKEGAQTLDVQRLDLGLASILKAIELDPSKADYRLWAGRGLERKGEIEGAFTRYRQAAKLDPENGAIWQRIGALHSTRGDLDEAKLALDKAVEFSEEHYELWYEVGRLAEQREDLSGARAAYEQAIAQAPTQDGPHFRLGNVLVQLGEEAAAEASLAAAAKWEKLRSALRYWHVEAKNAPQDADAAAGLARSYFALEEYTPCMQWLNVALGLDGKNVTANSTAGRFFYADGGFARSANHFAIALESKPENAGLLRELALAQFAAAQYENLRDTLERLLPKAPEDPSVQHLMGLALLSLERAADAETYLRKALALDPGNDDARVALAGALVDAQEWSEAAQLCEQVLARDGARADAQEMLLLARNEGKE